MAVYIASRTISRQKAFISTMNNMNKGYNSITTVTLYCVLVSEFLFFSAAVTDLPLLSCKLHDNIYSKEILPQNDCG